MGIQTSKLSPPSEMGGWRWDGNEATYDPRTIFDYMDGAGELYLSYHFRSLSVRRFVKPGEPSITLEIYDMGSSGEAFGIFSYERQDEDAGIGQGSEYGGGLLRFWKGRYFASVYSDGESPEVKAAILAIGEAVARSIESPGKAPELIALLPGPEDGLMERNLCYFHGHLLLNRRFFVANKNILLMGSETEAVLAPYLRGGPKKCHLLIVRYPHERQAGMAFESFTKAYMPEVGGKGELQTEDQRWTVARPLKNFIVVVFGAPTEREARRLIHGVEERMRGAKGRTVD